MVFRKTVNQDMDAIMHIIKQAQEYFKNQNIDQWQNNYPNPEVIEKDIQNGYSYVLEIDEKIAGTAAVSFDGEKTYQKIYNGHWVSNGEYAVIHRMAVDNECKGKGISSQIIKHVEELCLEKGVKSIKVDTHEENIPMQKLLQKNEFTYCGEIFLEDNSKRIAFEKVL
ncbi:GNAT family N-acetyltransferase [Neobacillus mesonae]|uniref:GNAT family N-acetyltransferase n=1 Tax=Neobacillus mesonae TaxID=1193713 RepID=UPI00203AA0C7|nr:GNAT family N-acetyltransferase [Neobacillus mesonae]MCM3570843.1 GNAT family N-acetyltransferase [Neobacillus mesonae]